METLPGVAQVIQVNFTARQDCIVNGVVWFWHAELDSEDSIVTAPNKLLREVKLPRGAQRCSSHTWKQALQGVGPLIVQQGQNVPAKMTQNKVDIRWELAGFVQEDPKTHEPTLSFWEAGFGVDADIYLRFRDLTNEWLRALGSHRGLQLEVARAWSRNWFGTEDRDGLLALLARIGRHGINSVVRNTLLPLLFGSETASTAPRSLC